MPDQIHGHDVMKMMLDSGQSYTRDTLSTAIINRFGTDARFYTCSATNMTADELVEFLAKREKFIETDTGFNTAPEKICDH